MKTEIVHLCLRQMKYICISVDLLVIAFRHLFFKYKLISYRNSEYFKQYSTQGRINVIYYILVNLYGRACYASIYMILSRHRVTIDGFDNWIY